MVIAGRNEEKKLGCENIPEKNGETKEDKNSNYLLSTQFVNHSISFNNPSKIFIC